MLPVLQKNLIFITSGDMFSLNINQPEGLSLVKLDNSNIERFITAMDFNHRMKEPISCYQ